MTESATTAVAISPSAVLTMAPGANLSAYVQTVGAIPMLSQERELELAEKLFYDNCVDSARELVLAHLRFVVHVREPILAMVWQRPTSFRKAMSA